MGCLFRVSIPHTSRLFHQLRYRLVFICCIFSLLKQQYYFFIYREALAAKYSPTLFISRAVEEDNQSWLPDEESAHFQDRFLANRAIWVKLGEGWEGKTFMYQDSAIKTFTPGQSPFRNCAKGTANEAWPTEIPASLLLGGTERNATSSQGGFLPVRAYFMAASVSTAEWHLVTPLLKGGSLKELGTRERRLQKNYQDIDAYYRASFERLLHNMQRLHEAGYCHDDIKPDNIFVAKNANWVLGDLGNVRHVSHPYHTSRLWKENRQLEDCRANDVSRAMKSYVRFVRDSATDVHTFNAEFLQGIGPLNRLFLWVQRNASNLTSVNLLIQSTIERPQQHVHIGTDTKHTLSVRSRPRCSWFFGRWRCQHVVKQALQTRMDEKTARWWAMTWIFGVPTSQACKL